jgi:glycosyltransferase involved in cell wall biosynthesis
VNESNSSAPSASHRTSPRVAIIIPVCNEEACIGSVLAELLATVDREKYVVAVGVNDSSDRTAEIARAFPVTVAETKARGYGHGCAAAIEAVNGTFPGIAAYLFFAGDGASDPRDIAALVAAYEGGHELVLGARTMQRPNWAVMGFSHVVANLVLASWCGLLTGRRFTDLAPLRLIERRLFEKIAPREMTFGWTIEAQIAAVLLGARSCEVPARERRRRAGEQKVSGVTWRRTAAIGGRILAAGWRARRRHALTRRGSAAVAPEMLAQPQSGL